MKNKKQLLALILSLCLIVVGSIAAFAFNTSGFSVSVDRIYFDTESGTLSGLLYMPKGVSAENPAPTMVVTHGYLNSAEMQDANAIELSRRGFVVLALDQYDHGHSRANDEHTGAFFSFWPTSIFDAVTYMYGQPYVLKDAAGNGIIGVAGHSMGGFSSEYAVFLDETAVLPATGYRMIHAILTEGADYKWTSMLQFDTAAADATAGGRYYGKVAAQYDEFFFNPDMMGDTNTVVHKDYVNTPEGLIFLQQTEAGTASSETWYDTTDGGHRIVYQPAETHPWNHFSKTTTGNAIEFFKTAFADYSQNLKDIASNKQIWILKEYSELVALIGFIIFLMALASMLLSVPFFKNAKTGEAVITPAAKDGASKLASAAMFISTMVIPAVIFGTMYDGSYKAEAMKWLVYAAVVSVIIGIIGLVVAGGDKVISKGSCVVTIAGAFLYFLVTDNALNSKFFGNGQLFKAGVPLSIMKWALVCAMISVIVMALAYMFSKAKQGVTMANYGIKANGGAILSALVLAIVLTVAGYAVLFIVDILFKVDFRIWTFAFKTFEPTHITASLIYMPFFFIYYFVAGAGAVANTTSEKMQGIKGYVVASLTNMGGITVWLLLQYGLLFARGTSYYPTQALSGILLIALVPALAVASCFTKYLYKKTGNIYTAAFLNAILLTIMNIANTTVYWQL